MQKFTIKKKSNSGSILIQALVFGTISVVMIGALISWAGINLKASRTAFYREQALQISEAGIDYYRWHLAHAPTDYKDGNATSTGPYIHDFLDKDGVKIGTFSLAITPPPVGSTIVKIRSTGVTLASPTLSRSITVRLAIPSFAKYAVAANDNMRFGEGTEIFGPIHANGGIRFDGLAHNVISSAKDIYDDPDHVGNQEFGVHTHVTLPGGTVNDIFRPLEAPPNGVESRPDVFEAGRVFPAPAADFVGMTTDLAQIKSDAQASGRYVSSSGAQGYRIILKTNDTFDLYRVNQLTNPPSGCASTQIGWGTWTIRTSGGAQTFIANYAIPANGLIFVEDHVWVEGQISTARLTIASGRFPDNPTTRTNIIVNTNVLYTTYDGQDVLSLIAQGNVNVGLTSANTLRVDGALVAQNGRVGRHYYSSSCGTGYVRDSLTLYGMIASNIRYGFAYSDNTGYLNRDIVYDANLLYSPPPSFPLTSDQYTILSWDEL